MKKGKVVIAGAGPGDPDLITVKAALYLQHADVIITDRLASTEILVQYASPDAEVIFVGKEGHAEGSVSQLSINDLMVAYYTPEKLVVRLKGGDVAFFSNILDELDTLTANNIPFEIIPGVTAASGASAYAGIPLTARGISGGVRILSHYKELNWHFDYWKELASTKDTLVFYMSSNHLDSIAKRLLDYGAPPDRPIAVIEQATTPFQKVHRLDIREAVEKRESYLSPSLIIVGDTVKLNDHFSWFVGNAHGQYFAPALRRKNKQTNEYAGK